MDQKIKQNYIIQKLLGEEDILHSVVKEGDMWDES